jgi:hypothetical protein
MDSRSTTKCFPTTLTRACGTYPLLPLLLLLLEEEEEEEEEAAAAAAAAAASAAAAAASWSAVFSPRTRFAVSAWS